MESAWPRTIAASRLVILRAGSGKRALPGARPGRSAAKLTSSSGERAIAFRHAETERLNGSVGASLAPVRNLELEVLMKFSKSPAVVPANAGTHNHRRSSCSELLASSPYREVTEYGSLLSQGRQRSGEGDIHRRLRELGVEAALIEFRDQRPLQLVTLVEEGDTERKADIAEDLGVLGPGDHRARAHHRRQ